MGPVPYLVCLDLTYSDFLKFSDYVPYGNVFKQQNKLHGINKVHKNGLRANCDTFPSLMQKTSKKTVDVHFYLRS